MNNHSRYPLKESGGRAVPTTLPPPPKKKSRSPYLSKASTIRAFSTSCHTPIRFNTVKAIILTRRIYNDFPKLTSLRIPKVTILTHSQRSIGQYMYRFLYNDFYFNDSFLLVNSLELALRYIYGFYSSCQIRSGNSLYALQMKAGRTTTLVSLHQRH